MIVLRQYVLSSTKIFINFTADFVAPTAQND
jgi:hypothetical protein